MPYTAAVNQDDIPLFPLNAVLFPGGTLSLRIFEPRYLDLVRECTRSDSGFGVCLIREGGEVGAPAVPAGTGTLARISAWDMPQLGVLHVIAVGEQRFRILERRVQGDGLTRASIQMIEEDAESTIP